MSYLGSTCTDGSVAGRKGQLQLKTRHIPQGAAVWSSSDNLRVVLPGRNFPRGRIGGPSYVLGRFQTDPRNRVPLGHGRFHPVSTPRVVVHLGQQILNGSSKPQRLFFHTDYRPLIRDSSHYVIDRRANATVPYPSIMQRLIHGRENCSISRT